ncbi:hypothetical protein DIZ27_24545 [Streptomyces sp. NWU339]|uniref:DUF3592 domain-containing protein n=1 Tax=Streptomyces sp. NWU339 TaxID=2185284 RepID=UPI000D67A859|nr:DUF3592 domain-containing protein [Streptomyces sp. NWU339]PWI08097.1 hypothetical protein DIZ27_24545 [Streptomyces sp. NWU339]
MEALFYVIPVIVIVGVSVMAARTISRSRQISGAWNHGLTAEGRCLRTYTRTRGGAGDTGAGDTGVRTTLHHVYEFTTREGRVIRFDEANGPSTVVEGDHVTVYYLADSPERATAHAPARGKLAAGTGGVLVFLGVVIAVCVGFMVIAHTMFTEADGLLP